LYYCEKIDVPKTKTKKGPQVEIDDLEKVVSHGSIIASEPLADHELWHEIPHNALMQVRQKELHKHGVSEHIRIL
jgi:predicted glutamine amidotransferase